jgi:hypothetical protein
MEVSRCGIFFAGCNVDLNERTFFSAGLMLRSTYSLCLGVSTDLSCVLTPSVPAQTPVGQDSDCDSLTQILVVIVFSAVII